MIASFFKGLGKFLIFSVGLLPFLSLMAAAFTANFMLQFANYFAGTIASVTPDKDGKISFKVEKRYSDILGSFTDKVEKKLIGAFKTFFGLSLAPTAYDHVFEQKGAISAKKSEPESTPNQLGAEHLERRMNITHSEEEMSNPTPSQDLSGSRRVEQNSDSWLGGRDEPSESPQLSEVIHVDSTPNRNVVITVS